MGKEAAVRSIKENFDAEAERSFTVLDLPENDRPRERMIAVGAGSLSDAELLCIILGRGVRGESVMDTARNLLSKFKSLTSVLEASPEELQQLNGLGPAKACQLVACFEIARRVINDQGEKEDNKLRMKAVRSPGDAADLIRSKILIPSKENFFVLSFDVKNKLIGIDQVSQGTLCASLVHPRETFEAVIRKHAARFMIAHNHPSGSFEPSDDDIKITQRLHEASKIMGIELLDHVIVTKSGYYSFKEAGIL